MGTGEDKQSGKGHCKSPIKCKTTQGEIPKITGAGEKRCPFGVPAVENMKQAADMFGK